jgi:predicted CoA-substrate-specific enzyme activase
MWVLGVDLGSVSAKFLVLDPGGEVAYYAYTRTLGAPLAAVTNGLAEARRALRAGTRISAVGTTGSGRYLAGAVLGADLIKNEITAHARGVLQWNPSIRTIMEIGGQDSKIIHLRDSAVTDFAMNTVCAAGTGAFLDQQAVRLQIPIEQFGAFALTATRPVRIAGRCSVFAESDMIHKQQAGCQKSDICLGLCQALIRNYLNNVARGRPVHGPVSFQGGVSCNQAIVKCLRDALPGLEILVPPLATGYGALGAALLAREAAAGGRPTAFRGWQHGCSAIRQAACNGCANQCDVFVLEREGTVLAKWGGRCERGNTLESTPEAAAGWAPLAVTTPGAADAFDVLPPDSRGPGTDCRACRDNA